MRILTFGVSDPTTEAWPLTRYVCDESSSEEGKTGKVIENDRIFRWVRLLDNECAPPCLVGRASHSFGYGLQVARAFTAQIGGGKPRSCRLGFPGFAVRRTKSSLFFVPAGAAPVGGRCFEKIRTSCVYVWHRWRLHFLQAGLQFAVCRFDVASSRVSRFSFTGWSKPATYSDLMK